MPIGVIIGAAAFAGYAAIRELDDTAGVAGGRTVATIVG